MKITIIIVSLIIVWTIIMLLTGCFVVKTTELTRQNSKANMYYHLPKGLLKITSNVKVFVYTKKDNNHLRKIVLISQSFDYTREIVPDNTQTLKLQYVSNPLSKDNVDIKINEKGLLSNVDITTEDRLPNIIETITKAPVDILGVGGASKGENDDIVTIEEFSKTFTIDPIDFPNENTNTQNWVISKNDNYGNSKDLNVSFSIEMISPTKMNQSSNISFNEVVKGVITRPMSLYKFGIKPKADMLDGYQVEFYEYLPNLELNIQVPITRALFAKKTNNLVFSDGMIKENKIDKPSEVEGFVSIPINLAKAIVSVPGQLFQFRIDNTKRKTELEKEILNLDKAITDNERNELLKTLETEKKQLEFDKSLLTLQNEIETMKNEMALMSQVSELENQKKLLGLEKEVSNLTNETKLLKEEQVLKNEKTLLELQKEIKILQSEIEKLKN